MIENICPRGFKRTGLLGEMMDAKMGEAFSSFRGKQGPCFPYVRGGLENARLLSRVPEILLPLRAKN